MITVAGEALMDIVVGASGSVTALPGGAPFNVARTIARLGGECQFVGKLSDDAFGEQLRASLAQDGVRIAVTQATSAPTTLAIAQLDDFGTAEYRFYLEETAAAQLSAADIPDDVLNGSSAVALGGLGLLIEPAASSLKTLIERKPPLLTTLLDPNCRPGAIKDLRLYREMIDRLLQRIDVVKVSVDDLRLLRPESVSLEAARSLLALGPGAVLVTDGPAPISIHTAVAERSVAVPLLDVVDTIGAGDAFVAAFLTWWTNHSLRAGDVADIDALVQATTAAIRVAVAACTVHGATLPPDFLWLDDEPQAPVRLASS
jgi:fructokinase